MKQFIEFVKSLHTNRFENLFAKIKSEKIPCAIYAPLISKQSRFDRIKYFRDLGVNVTTLFTIDPDDFENPPYDIDIVDCPPPPENQISLFSSMGTCHVLPQFLDFANWESVQSD